MRTFASIFASLSLLCVICIVTSFACGDGLKANTSSAAYARGVEEARRELAAGTASLYVYGEMSCDYLDRETGLPQVAIAGCVVSSEIIDRAAGHNEAIRASIREHGLPANSRKKWETELFDLRAYWTATTKTAAPIDLSERMAMTDQGIAVSWIEIVQPSLATSATQPAATQPAVVVGSGEGERLCRLSGGARHPELIWGPEGAEVAIVKTIADETQPREWKRFYLIDLRSGQLLRYEFHQD